MSLKGLSGSGLGAPNTTSRSMELTPILSSRSGTCLLLDTRMAAGAWLGTSPSAITEGTQSCFWELQAQGGAQGELWDREQFGLSSH